MSILGWIILGGAAGWIAALITGARSGLLANIAIGIVGAFIGGFVFSQLGATGFTGFNGWSLFVAVVGAVIFILIAAAIRGRRR
ncbi:MAG: GlsB/YeaQ/YmgE family stress response membrane protein [Armatimonadetes bacterium]|nr:GlsB/YeaQ/YmgE family stress response membrane protein [Armatimonadota bacterium]